VLKETSSDSESQEGGLKTLRNSMEKRIDQNTHIVVEEIMPNFQTQTSEQAQGVIG